MDDLYWLDKHAVRRSFDRAAESYDDVAVLQREVGVRLIERLDFIRMQPKTILDLGAGTGFSIKVLRKRYRKAHIIGLDFSHKMLIKASFLNKKSTLFSKRPNFICADAEHIPVADKSVDMIVSNLALQWCYHLDDVFQECRRILKPGGLFMFSTLGPDTLKELRKSWQAVGDDAVHVNRFIDLHDVGDALLRNRFSDPVMDMEPFTLTYSTLKQMLHELKALGAHNVNQGRAVALTGKQRLKQLTKAYEEFRVEDKLPATYEVIYGHAWAPEQETQRTQQGDIETHIPLSSIRPFKGS